MKKKKSHYLIILSICICTLAVIVGTGCSAGALCGKGCGALCNGCTDCVESCTESVEEHQDK